jgi:hypothetical protein
LALHFTFACGGQYNSIPVAPVMRINPAVTYASPSYANASGFALSANWAEMIESSVTATAAGSFFGLCTLVLNARM